MQLFQIIKNEYPQLDSPNLSKENVFQKVFNDKNKSDSSLRALMSQLTNLLYDFLSLTEYQTNKNLKNRHLLNALRNKNLKDLFTKNLQSAFKDLNKQKYRDVNYFFHHYRLSELQFEHDIVYSNRSPNLSLKDLVRNMDIFYLSSKLKYGSALLNLKNVLKDKDEYDLYLFYEALSYSEKADLQEIPLIRIYYHIFKLYIEDKEEHFYAIKEILIEKSILPSSEQRQIYAFLSNYGLRKVRQGKNEFLNETLQLYKQMVEDKVVLAYNTFISPHLYRNIATLGISLKDYEWTELFIESYKNKIHPLFRNDLYKYTQAALNFSKEDYDRSKEFLIDIQFIDSYYHIHCKILLIKTFYELNEQISIDSSIEAFRIWLMREKSLAKNIIESCKNFVSIMKKILRSKKSNKPVEHLIEELKAIENIAERQWLMDKLNSFE